MGQVYSPKTQCHHKRTYTTKTEAKLIARNLGKIIQAYRCPWCENYHVGHKVETSEVG